MALRDLRLAVNPGPGLVVRVVGALLMVPDASHPSTASLVKFLAESEDSVLLDHLFSSGATFCVLLDEAQGIRLGIGGELAVVVVAGGSRRVFSGRTNELLPSLAGVQVGDTAPTGGHDLLDLVEGVVPAGGFELALRSAARQPGIDPGSTVVGVLPPIPAEAREQVKRAATHAYQTMAAPEHAAPPEVEGVLCASSHLNDPAGKACWICGAQLGTSRGSGPRPPLGRVSTRDRRSWVLDGNFVLGRKPDISADVQAGRARPIVVPPELTGVSRAHAEIALEGWTILVRDLGSANGTFVLPPGAGDWQRVDPAQPVAITSGTVVTAGGFEFVVEPL